MDMLGPRDLVKAKQVCKRWAMAVRRYIGHLDAARTSALMEMAFFEPVPIYAVVNLGQTVRDLTMNENKEVFVLGSDNIIQLDTLNFTMNKTLVFEKREDPKERPVIPNLKPGDWWSQSSLYCSSDGCEFEVEDNWTIFQYSKSNSSAVLEFVGRWCTDKAMDYQRNPKVVDTKILSKTSNDTNLRRALKNRLGGETQIYELASNAYLVTAGNVNKWEEETLVAMIWEKNNSVTMKLIAKIGMRDAKLRVIGTRVFCYENFFIDRESSHNLIVFDVWNAMSVEKLVSTHGFVGPVTIEQTNIRSSKTVSPLEYEEGEWTWKANWKYNEYFRIGDSYTPCSRDHCTVCFNQNKVSDQEGPKKPNAL